MNTYTATYPALFGAIVRPFATEVEAHDWLRRTGHTRDGTVRATP